MLGGREGLTYPRVTVDWKLAIGDKDFRRGGTLTFPRFHHQSEARVDAVGSLLGFLCGCHLSVFKPDVLVLNVVEVGCSGVCCGCESFVIGNDFEGYEIGRSSRDQGTPY